MIYSFFNRTGVLLRDVLKEIGLEEGKEGNLMHIQFEGFDKDITNQSYEFFSIEFSDMVHPFQSPKHWTCMEMF
jgi:hypothetical protein